MDDIINHSGTCMNAAPLLSPEPVSRVVRVRHELVRRRLTVLRTRRLSPHLLAVTAGGPELAGFTSLSFDDHVKLLIPGRDGTPVMRDYTPRAFDAERQELTIEFALHGGGAADTWAAGLQAGDTLALGGPRGSMVIPSDLGWHLLAGDLSAVPAMRRRLQELPAGARVTVLGLWPDAADDGLLDLPGAATVQRQVARSPEAFLAALREWTPPAGEGFAWCAGDAATMAGARDALLQHHRLPKEWVRVAAYWKPGASDFHERLEG